MRIGSSRVFLVAAAMAAILGGAALGQDLPKVVEARMALETDGVHVGSAAKAAVVGRVKSGFHINAHHPSLDYLIPTEVKFQGSEAISVEKVVYPQGQLAKFAFSEDRLSVYEGEVPIGIVFRVSKSVSSQTISLRGKLTYQACNDHACFPPASVPLSLTLKVLPSGVPLRAESAEVFSKIKFK